MNIINVIRANNLQELCLMECAVLFRLCHPAGCLEWTHATIGCNSGKRSSRIPVLFFALNSYQRKYRSMKQPQKLNKKRRDWQFLVEWPFYLPKHCGSVQIVRLPMCSKQSASFMAFEDRKTTSAFPVCMKPQKATLNPSSVEWIAIFPTWPFQETRMSHEDQQPLDIDHDNDMSPQTLTENLNLSAIPHILQTFRYQKTLQVTSVPRSGKCCNNGTDKHLCRFLFVLNTVVLAWLSLVRTFC